MMILDAVALEAGHIIHDQLHQHHWGQEGEDHGRCGRGCRPFIPGDVLGMIVEIPSDLPLEHGIPEQPYHREHGEGRKPFGFLQPHRTDGSGMLAPTTAWFHRAMLCLIRLEQLGIRTPFWRHRGREDGPPVRILGWDEGLRGHDKARADRDLGRRGLRRTASTRPFFRDIDRFDPRVQDLGTPRPGLAPTPPLAPPFVLGNGRLGGGGTGKPRRFHMLDVLCDTLGFLGLRCGIRDRRLVGPRARVDDQKADLCHSEAPISVLHGHATDDTLPMPASRRLLPGPTRFFEP